MSTYIANTLNVDKARADKMRYEYWQKYGTSLAGLMKNFKIDPDHFLEIVHNIDFSVLSKDPKLLNALGKLPGRKIVYTNGTVPYAREVLKYRGLADVFDEIYGVENANYIPKPSPEAFKLIFAKANVIYNRSAMFEDEVRNLKAPFDLGLKTILICDSPTNETYVDYSVKNLPDFLRQIISTSLIGNAGVISSPTTLIYDLSTFSGDSSVSISVESSCKWTDDIVLVDDFNVFNVNPCSYFSLSSTVVNPSCNQLSDGSAIVVAINDTLYADTGILNFLLVSAIKSRYVKAGFIITMSTPSLMSVSTSLIASLGFVNGT